MLIKNASFLLVFFVFFHLVISIFILKLLIKKSIFIYIYLLVNSSIAKVS